MVTDGGQLIRCPVGDISINGRTTRGVKLFATAEGERVVSVSRIRDVEEGREADDGAREGPDDVGPVENGLDEAQQGDGPEGDQHDEP